MPDDRGSLLLRIARDAITASFEHRHAVVPAESWLREYRAAFVSLHQRKNDALRGCIGSIEAVQPLGDAVVAAAIGAAFRDTRFAPLAVSELALVRVDISVLSPLEPLPVRGEADAVAKLARERPGIVFRSGWRRSVLLPKVWESVEDAGEFLRHLKLKAGLPATYWSDAVELSAFTCEEFAEVP